MCLVVELHERGVSWFGSACSVDVVLPFDDRTESSNLITWPMDSIGPHPNGWYETTSRMLLWFEPLGGSRAIQ